MQTVQQNLRIPDIFRHNSQILTLIFQIFGLIIHLTTGIQKTLNQITYGTVQLRLINQAMVILKNKVLNLSRTTNLYGRS